MIGPGQVSRLTVELLGPVPVGEVRVTARIARPGRSVELVEVELIAGGRPAARARAWRIRTTAPNLTPSPTTVGDPPALPATPAVFTDPVLNYGFLAAMDWRFVSGSFDETGPARVWARQRVPLIDGEETTGLQRLIALADCGNGLSRLHDFATWWFINVELTVHLHREPVGEWMFAGAVSTLDPSGVGVAETQLSDATGPVGRGAQALLIGRRP